MIHPIGRPLSKRDLANILDLATDAKIRSREQKFILEGTKHIREMLSKPDAITQLVYASGLIEKDPSLLTLLAEATPARLPIYHTSTATLARISNLTSPQGLIAVCKMPHFDSDKIISDPQARLIIGDGIQDPVNAGAIARTAQAFAFSGILFSDDSASVFTPRGVRASSGAVLTLPVFYIPRNEIMALKKKSFIFLAGASHKGTPLEKVPRPQTPYAIIFGNEGRGISQDILRLADTLFTIPISEQSESLNVSSSAAIAMYYFSGSHRPS